MTNRYRDKQYYVPALLQESRPIATYREPTPELLDISTTTPAQTIQQLKTSQKDRAIGFTIATGSLAAIVGAGGLLIVVAGWGVPVLSVSALAIFFGLAALTWLIAWVWFNAASPDGIGLIGVVLHYRLLRYEQRARLERIDALMEIDR